jgi:hypothetical protein
MQQVPRNKQTVNIKGKQKKTQKNKSKLVKHTFDYSSSTSQCNEHQGTSECKTSKETKNKTQKNKNKLANHKKIKCIIIKCAKA